MAIGAWLLAMLLWLTITVLNMLLIVFMVMGVGLYGYLQAPDQLTRAGLRWITGHYRESKGDFILYPCCPDFLMSRVTTCLVVGRWCHFGGNAIVDCIAKRAPPP